MRAVVKEKETRKRLGGRSRERNVDGPYCVTDLIESCW